MSSPTWSSLAVALLGVVAGAVSACEIPEGPPLSTNIPEYFSIFVSNPAFPAIHNKVMTFRPNGDDQHLNLAPAGNPTGDTLWLENGRMHWEEIHAVIDLEYNEKDDTTKMFMTERSFVPHAVFQPEYICNPDTDELEIKLTLVQRATDPPVLGGQIGVRFAGDAYEFRYSPPGNTMVDPDSIFYPIDMIIFRGGEGPPPPSTTATISTTSTSIPQATGTPHSIGDYEYVSCWAEPESGGRTLSSVFSTADMTNEKCATLCGGSTYFGTQWSRECWCGSSLNPASHAAGSEAECNYPCIGNSAEMCGGSVRLSLYRLSDGSTEPDPTTTASASTSTSSSTSIMATSTTFSTSTITSTSTSTSTSSSTSTSTSTTPTETSIGTFEFVSCWAEPASGSGRALTSKGTTAGDMTLEKCSAFCAGYPYFGVEWGRECYCGIAPVPTSAAAPAVECDYQCVGNVAQTCGGSRRLSLYHDPTWVAPSQPASVAGYEFDGCYSETAGRALNAKSMGSPTLTLEACAAFCDGYTYFGAEWSIECYCGNAFTAGAAEVDSSQCSMTCGGNDKTFCGNGDRLSVYKLAPVV